MPAATQLPSFASSPFLGNTGHSVSARSLSHLEPGPRLSCHTDLGDLDALRNSVSLPTQSQSTVAAHVRSGLDPVSLSDIVNGPSSRLAAVHRYRTTPCEWRIISIHAFDLRPTVPVSVPVVRHIKRFPAFKPQKLYPASVIRPSKLNLAIFINEK